MERLLFVVAQDRPDLYSYLTWHFSSEPGVQVILDRRRLERRERTERHDPDRRRGDRRQRPRPGADPLSLSQVVTRRIEATPDRIPPGFSLRFRPFGAGVRVS